MTPFLDRPVSADGQEKVCNVSGSNGGLSPSRGRVAADRPDIKVRRRP